MIRSLSLGFSERMHPETVPADGKFGLRRPGADGQFDTADDVDDACGSHNHLIQADNRGHIFDFTFQDSNVSKRVVGFAGCVPPVESRGGAFGGVLLDHVAPRVVSRGSCVGPPGLFPARFTPGADASGSGCVSGTVLGARCEPDRSRMSRSGSRTTNAAAPELAGRRNRYDPD
jgi:hypothetical protein